MVELRELISRGRFIFSGAPRRFEIFRLINDKRSTKEIAKKIGRSLPSVLNDTKKLKDMGLIEEKRDKEGNVIRKERAVIYKKISLIKHVPLSYFRDVAETSKLVKETPIRKVKGTKLPTIRVPSENEILDISKHGEDQLYEFKLPGTKTPKITKEIAAFLHTKNGGIIFYGIDDEGIIIGSDIRRQEFDQKIQNSIRNTISSSPSVIIKERNVMGSKIIMIIIPPWDRKTLYQYKKTEKYLIRKGTNIFAVKPSEMKKLSRGKWII